MTTHKFTFNNDKWVELWKSISSSLMHGTSSPLTTDIYEMEVLMAKCKTYIICYGEILWDSLTRMHVVKTHNMLHEI